MFWGIALATWRGSHIGVDVLWEHCASAGRRRIDLLATALTLAQPVDWNANDEVVIAPTDVLVNASMEKTLRAVEWGQLLQTWCAIGIAQALLESEASYRSMVTALSEGIVVFDAGEVGHHGKRRVYDLPGGAARLTTDALGVHGVWVNGAQVADGRGLLEKAPLAGELLTQFSR